MWGPNDVYKHMKPIKTVHSGTQAACRATAKARRRADPATCCSPGDACPQLLQAGPARPRRSAAMEQELAPFAGVWQQIAQRNHWEWEMALTGIAAVRGWRRGASRPPGRQQPTC